MSYFRMTSAQPDELDRFSAMVAQALSDFEAELPQRTRALHDFNAASHYRADNWGLFNLSLPMLVTEVGQMATRTALLARAVRLADRFFGGGPVPALAVDIALGVIAREEGINLRDVFDVADVPVYPPWVGAVPQNSGFVSDPVCTGTLHMVVGTADLPFPDRGAVAAWPRLHSSGLVRPGPLGPGWHSWASVRLVTARGGRANYRGPDGTDVDLQRSDDGSWDVPDHLDVRIETGDTSTTFHWGRSSRWPGQSWTFGTDGLPRSVVDPRFGATVLDHDAEDRLRAVRPTVGQAIELDWDGDRIAELRSEDGSVVRYGYDAEGRLVEVARPVGAVTYELDDTGRVLAERDADGVVAVRTEFDPLGHVVGQDLPDGRELRFGSSGRRSTDLRAGDGELLATFDHDAAARITAIDAPALPPVERDFDGTRLVRTRLGEQQTEFRYESTDDGGERVVRLVDGEVVEAFRHDARGRLVEWNAPDAPPATFDYDADGRVSALRFGRATHELRWSGEELVWYRDADGVEVERQVEGATVAVTSAGRRVESRLDERGDVVALDAGAGRYEFGRDPAGRLTSLTDPAGSSVTVSYSAAGRPLTVRSPGGTLTELAYDPAGRIARVADDGDAPYAFEWWDDERLAALIVPDGGRWEFTWSPAGELAGLLAPDGRGWRMEDDDDGRLVRRTDHRGAVTEFRRPSPGVVEVTGPGGDRWLRTVSPDGRVEELIDPIGRIRRWEWDAEGRLRRVVGADGLEQRLTWSPAGRLVAVDGAVAERRSHDAAGRVASVERDGGVVYLEYDAAGEMSAWIEPDGVRTEVLRDHAGRPIEVTRGGARWTYAYDEDGRLVSRGGADGAVVRFERSRRAVRTVDPLGAATVQDLDWRGAVVATVSPLGRRSLSERDAWGHTSVLTDPLGRTTRLVRDLTGEIERVEHPDATTLVATTDPSGRAVGWSDDDGPLLDIDWDPVGRPVRIRDARTAESVDLEWDPADGVAALVTAAGTDTWERGSDTTSCTLGGVRFERGHDAAGRDLWVRGGGVDAELTRGPDGSVTSISAGGAEIRYLRDRGAGTDEVVVDGRVVTVLRRDVVGRVVERSDDGGATRFTYDAAGQLTAADGRGGSWRWTYDADGCLIEESGPTGLRRFNYDDAAQLVAVAEGGGETSFSYDARGRRVHEAGPRGERSYEWTPLGRLAAVTVDGRRIELRHDPLGRLVEVDGTPVRWDLRAGTSGLLGVGDERVVVVGGVLVRSTAEGPVVDDPVRPLGAEATPGGDWWGHEPGRSAASAPTIGWRGEVAFAGGLIWLRGRVYDPATRSFLTPDPVSVDVGAPWAANPYHYAGNDPVNHVDPTGLSRSVSMDELQRAYDDSTGPQWGTIIADVVTVLAVVGSVAFPGAAVLIGVAAGAAGSLGQRYGDAFDTGGLDEMGRVDHAAAIGGAIVAGAVGGVAAGGSQAIATKVGAKVAPHIGNRAGHVVGQAVGEATTGGASSVVTQFASTGRVDWSDAAFNAGLAGATSAAASGIKGGMDAPAGGRLDAAPPPDVPVRATPAAPPQLPAPRPQLMLAPPSPQLMLPPGRPQLLLEAPKAPLMLEAGPLP